ncbi:MAG: hypothetical protein HBSAPP02_18650 [Phycisphaerae bacterium]|nr:MAG: hypothetical protein HRU71_15740 [Planctomycetia bacterium]RIK69576.1 MAG: hypothetical protein DCC66_08355 [Planctomycetota bacterium]GJQ26833.1 MAG: hypothetical protein HBSAPP02_18650 [Phycisphaerae bacterium]
MQPLLKILAALFAIGVVWQAVRTPGASDAAPPEDDATQRAHQVVSGLESPAGSTPPPRGQYRGMAMQLHVNGVSAYDHYHRLIPEIAQLGADTVLFVVHGWQEHAGTVDLHIDTRRTPDAKDLGRLIDHATQHGLRVILMPIVLLKNPRNSEWRGRIVPENHDWDGWFTRYRDFIVHFAKIAERHRVDVLMIGSELVKTETYTERWLRIIEEVRQNYRGKLGYSANWDHYQTTKIGFWPRLDVVGMTSYYELARKGNPLPSEIDQNWARIKRDILSFQREVKKPIIFTEVGWCSQEGAAHEGWNYYANQKATPAGHEEQRRLYESFLRTWGNEPAIGGIIWWEWDTSEGGMNDFNYTPRGKPAEKVLRDWFAETSPAKPPVKPTTILGTP